MKINIFKYSIYVLSILIILITLFSTVGIETDKLNKQIKNRIIEINKNLDLELKKIKLTLDPFNFKINAKTIGAKIFYSTRPLELEFIKTEIPLSSLINRNIIFSNLKISTRSILLNDLIGFVRSINNSPQLFLIQKFIKKGQIILDLDIYFDEFGNIKDNYKFSGSLINGQIRQIKSNSFENIFFNFNIKKDSYLLQDLKFRTNKINFTSKALDIKKKDRYFYIDSIIENKNSKLNNNFLDLFDIKLKNVNFENVYFSSKNKISFKIDKTFNFKNPKLKSEIKIDEIEYKKPIFFNKYFINVNEKIPFKNHKLKLEYFEKKLKIEGNGKIKLYDKLNEINYLIFLDKNKFNLNSNIKLKKIILKKRQFLKNFFPNISDQIILKDQKISIKFKKNILSINGKGDAKIDKDYDKINYFISKNNNEFDFNVGLSLQQTNFKISQLNYRKKNKSKFQLNLKGNYRKDKILNIDEINISEQKNYIKIKDLVLGSKYKIIQINKANFNYTDTEKKLNKFNLKKLNKNNYKFDGVSFNANTLITKILEDKNKKRKRIFNNDLKLNFDIKKVYIDDIYFIQNFNGKLLLQNNEVINANLNANFSNKKKISFTRNLDNEGNKITTLTSSWAKPLVNRYKFIKGFEDDEEGYLDFYSTKKDNISNSLLIIDNFKVKEIPALAKLLALASLQGVADLLTGEGIRFTDFEMKFTNEKNNMKIEELYAIGPAISILMEGYIDNSNLISLRGTLVPATTINRSIASIPLIGDLLVGKKVGEGVFGVSFKIKGPPKNMETSVNPIKTLTPRFITRTLEKIKKN